MKTTSRLTDSQVESLLADAADEFTAAFQRGENPNIDDYAKRYPQLAESIRSLFPALTVLDTPCSSTMRTSNNTATRDGRTFDTLGDFKIVGELGRGGMGVVYRAEQTSLGRTVALKVLPVSALLDGQQLARFKNEARAAATLGHPNIVPVYSVGVEEGVHFYAMRLIDGLSIAEIIQSLRGDDGTPQGTRPQEIVSDLASRSLANSTDQRDEPDSTVAMGSDVELKRVKNYSIRTHNDGSNGISRLRRRRTDNCIFFRNVAQLGVQAARALAHAHSHGVLHRDIKPANLLVDRRAHLWVTDFGVARLEGDAGLTASGDLLGTVRYMSPEQAIGERIVDQRTDVYSLGVTLYEILTLRPAFSGNDRLELLQKIASDTPVRPRRIVPTIPIDLETIVLKAIEKDPGDRYPSARALAEDLRCFLENRPIAARRPSIIEMAAKWSRRHQPFVWAAVATMTLAVILLAVSTMMIGRAYRSTENQRQVAEENLQLALKVIDNGYAKEVELLKHEPGMTAKQRDFLTAIVEFYEQLPAEKLQDETLMYKACHTRLSLGDILRALGRDDDAIPNYEAAIDIAQRLQSRSAQLPKFKRALALGHDGLGQTLRQNQRFEQAASAHQRAMQLADELIAAYPDDVEMQRLATLRLNHALAIRETAGKEDTIRATIQSVEALGIRFPAEIEFNSCLAQSLDQLGSLLSATGRKRDAEKQFRKALEIQQQLAKAHPSIPGFRYQAARIQNHLAVIMSEQGRCHLAEQANHRAVEALRKLTTDFPHRIAYQFEFARLKTDFGRLQFQLEHFDEAQRAFSDAIHILETLVTDEDSSPRMRSDLATNYGHLGNTASRLRQYKLARQCFQDAHEIWSKLADQYPDDPTSSLGFASSRARMSSYLAPADGVKELAAAVTSARSLAQHYPERVEYTELVVRLLGGYSAVLRSQGRTDEAEQQTLSAIAVANRFADRFPEENPFLWSGDLSWQMGDFSQAVVAHQAAADNYRILIAQHPDRPRYRADLATSLKRLGNAHVRTGNFDAALQCYQESISIAEALAAEYPDVAAYQSKVQRRYQLLGEFYLGTGQLEKSAAAFRTMLNTAKTLHESFPNYPQSSGNQLATRVRLANILLEQNPPSLGDAERELRNAVEMCHAAKAAPIRVSLMCQLAAVRAQQEKTQEALATLRDALQLVNELSGAIQDDPETLRRISLLRWEIAAGFSGIGEFEKADQIVAPLITESARADAAWLQTQAWCLANFQHDDESQMARAVELADLATKLNPDDANAWHSLGVAQYRANQYDAAADSLRKSLSLKPTPFAVNHLFLAMTEFKRGRLEEASKNFELGSRAFLFSDPYRLMRYRSFRDEASELMKRDGSESNQ